MLNDVFDTFDSGLAIIQTCFSMIILLIILNVFVAIWVYKDAEARKQNAAVWLVIVLFAPLIGVVLWLILRGNYPSSSPEEDERLLFIRGRKRVRIVLLVIIVAFLMAVASSGALIVQRIDRFGDDINDYNYDELEPYSESWDDTYYLFEGDFEEIEVFDEVVWWFIDWNVVIVDTITIDIHWRDENDDNGFLYEYNNEPDTVGLTVTDTQGLINFNEEASNPEEGEGMISFSFTDPTMVFGYGDEDEVDLQDYDTVWNDTIVATLTLIESRDHVHPVRNPNNDSGNIVRIEITVSGREH